MVINSGPVSYTHLDVYKRQAQNCRNMIFTPESINTQGSPALISFFVGTQRQPEAMPDDDLSFVGSPLQPEAMPDEGASTSKVYIPAVPYESSEY